MRFGIPVMASRVAPQVTKADGLLILQLNDGQVLSTELIGCAIHDQFELLTMLQAYEVGTLVCGLNSLETEAAVRSLEINIIDNVFCSIDRAVEALKKGRLRSRQRAMAS